MFVSGSTKNRRWIEKRIPKAFNRVIDLYLKEARPILMKSPGPDNSLWISLRTGRRFTYKNLGTQSQKLHLKLSAWMCRRISFVLRRLQPLQ